MKFFCNPNFFFWNITCVFFKCSDIFSQHNLCWIPIWTFFSGKTTSSLVTWHLLVTRPFSFQTIRLFGTSLQRFFHSSFPSTFPRNNATFFLITRRAFLRIILFGIFHLALISVRLFPCKFPVRVLLSMLLFLVTFQPFLRAIRITVQLFPRNMTAWGGGNDRSASCQMTTFWNERYEFLIYFSCSNMP